MISKSNLSHTDLTHIYGGSAGGKGLGFLQAVDWATDAVKRFKRDVKKYGNPTKV